MVYWLIIILMLLLFVAISCAGLALIRASCKPHPHHVLPKLWLQLIRSRVKPGTLQKLDRTVAVVVGIILLVVGVSALSVFGAIAYAWDPSW